LLIERDFTMDEQLKKIGIVTLLVGAALAAQAEEQRFTWMNHGKSHAMIDHRDLMNSDNLGVTSRNRMAFFSDEGVAERGRAEEYHHHHRKRHPHHHRDWDKDGDLEPPHCISPE
jgi:hypothetical protein